MLSRDYLLGRRGDISEYLVHLTRRAHDRGAESNLRRILKQCRIRAYNPHCLFNRLIADLSPREQKLFKTVCFTETPLGDLNYLTQPMAGRRIKLTSFGLVFRKQFVSNAGGNPVFYLDTRSEQGRERQNAFWKTFRLACSEGLFAKGAPLATFLPLVHKVDRGNDFSWEREWRVVGDVQFDREDVFLGLAPTNTVVDLASEYPEFPWVSPRWGRDRVLETLRDWE